MTTIPDILKPSCVLLDLKAATEKEAILQLAAPLRNDARVIRWEKLVEGLTAKPAPAVEEEAFDFAIPHARTEAVSAMVMAAGLLRAGEGGRPRYLFAIGVPQALSADYLRIVGGLGRIFRQPGAERALREADTPERFIALLHARELGD